jgi:hypothetical protein
MGLRLRLALTILIPLVAILGIFAYLKVDQDRAIRREDFTHHTEITSRAIRLAVEHALRHDSPGRQRAPCSRRPLPRRLDSAPRRLLGWRSAGRRKASP